MGREVDRLGEALDLGPCQHGADGVGEDHRVVCLDQAVPMARSVDFVDAADIGRNQRLRRGCGLENDIGQGFRTGRDDHDPRLRQRLADRPRRLEDALACDAATPGFVFCSVGQVVFIAPLVLGLLTWYVLALWNVRATLWALAAAVAVWAGLVSATSLVSRTLPTWLASLSSLTSFGLSWPSIAAQAGGMGVNAFLAALGLGAFGRPASQRFAGAWLASILCVVLGHALAPIGWPYFTLPFNLAVWTVLAVSRAQPSPESA